MQFSDSRELLKPLDADTYRTSERDCLLFVNAWMKRLPDLRLHLPLRKLREPL
jgi:hypothetical protein